MVKTWRRRNILTCRQRPLDRAWRMNWLVLFRGILCQISYNADSDCNYAYSASITEKYTSTARVLVYVVRNIVSCIGYYHLFMGQLDIKTFVTANDDEGILGRTLSEVSYPEC